VSITTKKTLDPLTRSNGFMAIIENMDSAFAFSEGEAVAKLLSRHKGQDFAVNWSNGSMTIYRKGEA
jgi:hypothetical protein